MQLLANWCSVLVGTSLPGNQGRHWGRRRGIRLSGEVSPATFGWQRSHGSRVWVFPLCVWGDRRGANAGPEDPLRSVRGGRGTDPLECTGE